MEAPITSIRLNPKKRIAEYAFPLNDPVPWSQYGYYLSERPSFTADPGLHGGAYYVQEASSMLIEHIMKQLPGETGPRTILDLCAAPGGKSTLLAGLLEEDDILVANEVIHSRYHILRENLIKWGNANVITTQHDPREFSKLINHFDIILVDAPCSGEGLWRKDPKAQKHWSEDHVAHCALRQQRILQDILPTLKPGGFLIYSTCTFNDIENINNVARLISETGMRTLDVEVNPDWNLVQKIRDTAIGYQVDPDQTRGEGFFFAVLQKTDNDLDHQRRKKRKQVKLWKQRNDVDEIVHMIDMPDLQVFTKTKSEAIFAGNSRLLDEIEFLSGSLSKCQPILEVGTRKREVFIPAHSLALSIHLSTSIKFLKLDMKTARKYLRRESDLGIEIPENGWYVAEFNGTKLGWIKIAGGKVKNHYPMYWRVRKTF